MAIKDEYGRDARVNGCAHDWDHLLFVCRRCGLTQRRAANAMTKYESLRAWDQRKTDAREERFHQSMVALFTKGEEARAAVMARPMNEWL